MKTPAPDTATHAAVDALRDAATAILLAARPGMTATSIVPNRNIKALAHALAALTPEARHDGRV